MLFYAMLCHALPDEDANDIDDDDDDEDNGEDESDDSPDLMVMGD